MTVSGAQRLPQFVAPDAETQANRMIVGMDDHPAALAALRFAATQAAYRGGDVLAIHVWRYPNTWGMPAAFPAELRPDAYIHAALQQAIAGVVAERAADGLQTVPITARVVEGFDAPALIAAAHGAAMLVLGARHHNRLLTSVSQACSDHPPCPVVLVPVPQRHAPLRPHLNRQDGRTVGCG